MIHKIKIEKNWKNRYFYSDNVLVLFFIQFLELKHLHNEINLMKILTQMKLMILIQNFIAFNY